MIKQDYIIRMIQAIITALAEVLLKKKKLRHSEKEEYDGIIRQVLGITEEELAQKSADELKLLYREDSEPWDKLELAALKLLQMAEEAEGNLLQQTRLRQNGLELLTTVQTEGNSFSLQRNYLIKLIKLNS